MHEVFGARHRPALEFAHKIRAWNRRSPHRAARGAGCSVDPHVARNRRYGAVSPGIVIEQRDGPFIDVDCGPNSFLLDSGEAGGSTRQADCEGVQHGEADPFLMALANSSMVQMCSRTVLYLPVWFRSRRGKNRAWTQPRLRRRPQ